MQKLKNYVNDPPFRSACVNAIKAGNAVAHLKEIGIQRGDLEFPKAAWGSQGALLLWWDVEDLHVEIEFTTEYTIEFAWWEYSEGNQYGIEDLSVETSIWAIERALEKLSSHALLKDIDKGLEQLEQGQGVVMDKELIERMKREIFGKK